MRQRVRRAPLEEREVRGGVSKAYDSVSAAKAGLGAYLAFYNTRRPHRTLGGKTPDAIYFGSLPQERIAA